MITPEINILASEVDKQYQQAILILKQQYNEIKKLPEAEQKPYLNEYYLISNYVNNSFDLLYKTLRELDKRPTNQEHKSVKDSLTKARKYIEILGGNPSNLTYA